MVHGEIVHGVIAFLEHRLLPLGIMVHEQRRGGAHCRLDASVDPLDGLGHFVGPDAVPSRILVPGAQLPGAVHLIAQVPGLHIVGLLMAVLPAQVGPPGSALMVGVLHNVHGVPHIPGAQVDGIEGLRPHLLRPLQVLVVAYLICDVLVPGRVQPDLPLFLRADGILPAPGRHEVPAGQAHRRHVRGLQGIDEVPPEALFVSGGVFRVEHGAVHHGADGLQEGAEQSGRDLPCLIARMDRDSCLFCHMFPFCRLFCSL